MTHRQSIASFAGWTALCLLLVLPLLAAACGKKEPDTAGTAQGGAFETILEAEDGAVEAPMEVRLDDGAYADEMLRASDGKFVLLPDKVGKGEEVGGKVKLTFTVDSPVKCMLWARVNWLDGCGNSFYLSVDGGPKLTFGDDGTYKHWQWVTIRGAEGVFRLGKGSHTVEFLNREDGAALDQVFITTNLDDQAQPQGILLPN